MRAREGQAAGSSGARKGGKKLTLHCDSGGWWLVVGGGSVGGGVGSGEKRECECVKSWWGKGKKRR